MLFASIGAQAELTDSAGLHRATSAALLQKVYHTGFVPDEMAYSLDCKIYADRVEIDFWKPALKKHIQYMQQVNSVVYFQIDPAPLIVAASLPTQQPKLKFCANI